MFADVRFKACVSEIYTQNQLKFQEWLSLTCPSGEGSSDNYAYLVVDDRSKEAVIIDPAHPEEYNPRVLL